MDGPVLGLCAHPTPSSFATLPPPPDPWNLHRPRFCLLSKEEEKSFGFHLQQQLGKADHVVCRVDPGTSAQRHGLREGDRILAVNNSIVEHEDYAVVRLGFGLLVVQRNIPQPFREEEEADTCLGTLGAWAKPHSQLDPTEVPS